MKVVVVGDVLLDVDSIGSARKLSPDGPVPVIDIDTEVYRPGGAGLTSLMLAKTGHEVTLVTNLAEDSDAEKIREGLTGVRIVSASNGGATAVKKRLLADGQVVARIDINCGPAAAPAVTTQMLAALADADAVLVSDYGRGLSADAALRQKLAEVAEHRPVVWDPHPNGAAPIAGIAAVTPNLAEAQALTETSGIGTQEIARTASRTLELWPVEAAVITLGKQGAAVLRRGDHLPQFFPLPTAASGDTCGAGDRFASALTAELACDEPLAHAVDEATTVAADFVARGGVTAFLARNANQDPDNLAARIADVRSTGGAIVATGGCFDLLHAGHARTLAAARNLGDFLVVCLNSDASVRRLKGDQRPIVTQSDRAELLAALGCVDAVVIFDEDTPESVLDRLRPDIWVKGGDYDIETLPEAKLVASWGGQAVTVPFHQARSTTRLAAALNSLG